MGMDPKQERALRDGSEKPEDQPRDTSRVAVREQEEHPPVEARAGDIGARAIPEAGKQRRRSDARGGPSDDGGEQTSSPNGNGASRVVTATRTPRDEAERTLRARREHSKGDGNMPSVESDADLVDERPTDRTPRDVPKERDDRSAPKGPSGMARARRDAKAATAARTPRRAARPTARRSSAAKRTAVKRTTAKRAKPTRLTARRGATRGNAPARKTKKANASRAKDARTKKKRR